MIYCVQFAEVETHLASLGYREIARIDAAVIFAHTDARRIFVRMPNQDGNVPETLVNDAFDAAGIEPPAWDVFWCD